jgi:phosphoenolpyruvate-protein kinase (PTS system EI component)
LRSWVLAVGAVIAAVGGKLAHLATVSRELGARLVVVDEAMTRFSEGDLVTLDLDESKVSIHGMNNPFKDDWGNHLEQNRSTVELHDGRVCRRLIFPKAPNR